MAKYFLILVLLLNFGLHRSFAQREYCCISTSHTLCQYQGFGQNCGSRGPISQSLTEDEKRMVVEMHNKYRSKVAQGLETRGYPGPQKPAADMLELTWDNELEKVAQRWADQCNFGHDSSRDVSRFSVGQNVYEASDFREGPIDLKRAVDGWYNEVKDVDNDIADNFRYVSGIGHYTQMVWASTHKIGCGYTSYKRGRFVKKFIVCNYGKAGNLLRAPMYQVGRPCSKCSSNTCSKNFPGLCTVPGETGFTTSNSMPAEGEGNIEPMFVDTNEVEKFNPQRPPYPKPTPHFPRPTNVDSNDFPMFSPRPTKPIFIKPRPNRPTFHRPRPNPMSFFHKLFSGLFQG